MHFQQSKYWKNLKQKVGNATFDFKNGWAQITTLPLDVKIGYVPPIKSQKIDWNDLILKAKKANCAYVTIDFDETTNFDPLNQFSFLKKTKSIRLKQNVINNLQYSETELLSRINKKDRYYIRNAEKKGVKVRFEQTEESFQNFLKLFLETKTRQNYHGRSGKYLTEVWKTFTDASKEDSAVQIYIGTANYQGEDIASWLLLGYQDTMYYPYGGSSVKYPQLGATYLLAWESLLLAKNKGFKYFDWMGFEKNKGFSSFKKKFGGEFVVYADSVDLVLDYKMYKILSVARYLREKIALIKKLF